MEHAWNVADTFQGKVHPHPNPDLKSIIGGIKPLIDPANNPLVIASGKLIKLSNEIGHDYKNSGIDVIKESSFDMALDKALLKYIKSGFSESELTQLKSIFREDKKIFHNVMNEIAQNFS